MSHIIHHEVVFPASPERIYAALTETQQFATLTGGLSTDISLDAGGSFSCFNGMIEGRHIELQENQLLVQAWRVSSWTRGVYSIVRFELRAEGNGTRLVFDHTGFPEAEYDHLERGWYANYWEPMKAFLSEPVSA